MSPKKMTVLLLTLLVVGAATSAQATRWDAFSATADCEGWSMEGMIKIGSSHAYVDVEYTVVASSAGEVIEEHAGTFRVVMDALSVPVAADGLWTADLSGDVTVAGTFFLPFTTSGDSIQTFEVVLDCGGDDDDGDDCNHGGYHGGYHGGHHDYYGGNCHHHHGDHGGWNNGNHGGWNNGNHGGWNYGNHGGNHGGGGWGGGNGGGCGGGNGGNHGGGHGNKSLGAESNEVRGWGDVKSMYR